MTVPGWRLFLSQFAALVGVGVEQPLAAANGKSAVADDVEE